MRKSFFDELGIYENETVIHQVYSDFILGKVIDNTEVEIEIFEICFNLILSSFM